MDNKEIAPVIIGKLLNIGGMLQRKANQLLLPHGLNQQQFSILFEIDKAGKVNQKTMVNRLVLEKAHVSKVVKKLSEMKLIGITVSPEDKRSTWLTVTPLGKEVVNSCQKQIGVWNNAWISEMDTERLPSLLDNLSELQKILKNNLQKDQEFPDQS